MDLSIIVVSWNVKDKLRENLKAIYASQGNFEFEIFVVDNNSYDSSADMVKNEFREVKLKVNEENLGLARAVNQVKDKITGDFILLLNPDNLVMPDTLENMLKWMRENSLASVAGCHLVDEKGETIKQVRNFPTAWDQLAIVLKLPHFFPSILKKYIREDFDYSQAAKVDSIRGAFFMIRIEMVEKIGLWDERYFLWFEEVDYCRQVVFAGGEVWYTPVAKCIDHVGQSFKQVKRVQVQEYFKDSMLKYFKKWHPAYQYWILKLVWPIGKFLAIFSEKIGLESKAKT